MSELVHKLAKGDHRVIFRAIQDNAVQELKECVDRNFVHVKFTETRGGTELGFELDEERSDLSKVDWEAGTGTVHFAGNLSLDYVKVRCVADIDISKMEGTGHLEILEEEEAAAEPQAEEVTN